MITSEQFKQQFILWFRNQDQEAQQSLTMTEVTKQLKSLTGLLIKVDSWDELRECLDALDSSAKALPSVAKLRDQHKFQEAKNIVSETLGYAFKAQSWSVMEKRLSNVHVLVTQLFPCSAAELFERNKKRNFIASSRLEGVTVLDSDRTESKESAIARILGRNHG